MTDPRVYRTIWRWHFYAGLVVAPFLLILAVTGAIYLFGPQLNDLTMPGLTRVAPVSHPLAPSRLIRAARAAEGGSPTRIDLPDAADRPATVYLRTAAGEPRQVRVDPGTARVLGGFTYSRTLVGFADQMHGSLMLGRWGDAVVEIAACWALVLLLTGLVLWWPRGRGGPAGVLWPRWRARGRLWWRDLHAVTGVWIGALVVFLILTGLPWAAVEGPLIRGALTTIGIGTPRDGFGYVAPASRPAGATLGRVPWGQETMPMPASDPLHADHHMSSAAAAAAAPDDAAIAGADAITAAARARGIAGGYRLHLPTGPTGIYTVITYPGRPQGQRTLHFDRWSGALLGETGWSRYGVGTRAVELGVQLHMGRYFGLANQLLMLLPCVGIVVLVATGVTMWWRRRPRGRLGAPPPLGGARLRGAAAVLAVMGVVMPLFGGTLLLVALLDRALTRLRRPAPG